MFDPILRHRYGWELCPYLHTVRSLHICGTLDDSHGYSRRYSTSADLKNALL